jgi:hypothetical protein
MFTSILKYEFMRDFEFGFGFLISDFDKLNHRNPQSPKSLSGKMLNRQKPQSIKTK